MLIILLVHNKNFFFHFYLHFLSINKAKSSHAFYFICYFIIAQPKTFGCHLTYVNILNEYYYCYYYNIIHQLSFFILFESFKRLYYYEIFCTFCLHEPKKPLIEKFDALCQIFAHKHRGKYSVKNIYYVH